MSSLGVCSILMLSAMEVLKQAKTLAPNDTGIDDMIQQCSVLEEEYAEANGTPALSST